MKEMYEKADSDKADSEKKEIREIREIFSSKSKFLGSVFSVQFMYDKIVGDSGTLGKFRPIGEIERQSPYIPRRLQGCRDSQIQRCGVLRPSIS